MASFSSSGRSAGYGFLPLNILKSSIKKRWWGLGRLPWHLVHWHQPMQLWATFLADGNWKVWTTWALVNNGASIQMTLWAFYVPHPLFLLFTFYPSQHHDLIHSNEVSSIAKKTAAAELSSGTAWGCRSQKRSDFVSLPEKRTMNSLKSFQLFLTAFSSADFLHTCLGMHISLVKRVHHWGSSNPR